MESQLEKVIDVIRKRIVLIEHYQSQAEIPLLITPAFSPIKETYDAFFESWFKSQQERLARIGLLDAQKGDFVHYCWVYTRAIALKFKEAGITEICFEEVFLCDEDKLDRWARFFGQDKLTLLTGLACPWKVQKSGILSLYNKEIVNYFAGLAEYDLKEYLDLPFIRGDEGLEYLTEMLEREVLEADGNQLRHLAADITTGDVSEEDFFRLVYLSSQNERFSRIAANAITVLNAVRVSFSGMDLSNIKIPRANLNSAVMSGTQLENADLQEVVFADAFLKDASFKNANMRSVNFQRRPFLPGHGEISSIAYDPITQWVFCATEISSGTSGVQVISLKSENDGKVISYAAQTCRSSYKIVRLSLNSKAGLLATLTHKGRDNEAEVKIFRIHKSSKWLKLEERFILPIKDEPRALSFSVDGKLFAIGGWRRGICYDLVTKKSHVLKLNVEEFVNTLAFSPSGNFLALAGECGSFLIYKIENDNFQVSFEARLGVECTCVEFSFDGKWIAVGMINGSFFLKNTQDKNIKEINFDDNECHALCFSDDSKYLILSTENNISKFFAYSLEACVILPLFSINVSEEIAGVSCVKKEGFYELIYAGTSGTVRRLMFDTELKTQRSNRYHYEHFSRVRGSNFLLALAEDKTSRPSAKYLVVKDIKNGRDRYVKKLSFSADCVALHPGLKIAAIGGREYNSEEGKICLYDLDKDSVLEFPLMQPRFTVTTIVFSRDGKYLFYGAKDAIVYSFELKVDRNNKLLKVKKNNPIKIGRIIEAIGLSDDNKWLAVGSDRELVVYNRREERIIFKDKVGDSVLSIIFSSSSDFIILNAGHSTQYHSSPLMLVFIKNEWRPYCSFGSHTAEVRSVILSLNDDFVVSTGKDGRLIFSEIPPIEERSFPRIEKIRAIYEFREYFSSPEYLDFDTENNLIVSDSGTLTKWKINFNPLQENKISIRLLWVSGNSFFYVKGLDYNGVKNISQDNRNLLHQMGGSNKEDADALFRTIGCPLPSQQSFMRGFTSQKK